MQKDEHEESLPLEIIEVMRTVISAIRAVKLYPPNNPIYSQSVKKSYDMLDGFLRSSPAFHMGVQKDFITYLGTPLQKDGQVNKPIAQDLFSKGIREIVFSSEVAESEVLELYRGLALSAEDLGMKGGLAAILWEKGATHIKVTESGLNDVVATKTEGLEKNNRSEIPVSVLDPTTAKHRIMLAGRSIVLDDLMTNPDGFAAGMVELAQQTRGEKESLEEKLLSLYVDAGRAINQDVPGESETLFEGLANSALSLESPLREALIADKLYGMMDSEIVSRQSAAAEEQLQLDALEVVTGRFSDSWRRDQVSVLLKKAVKRAATPATPLLSPSVVEAEPVPREFIDTVKNFADYSPEEMASLKRLSEAGMESDIVEAAVRTLLFLLPLVKKSPQSEPEQKEREFFSNLITQLEEIVNHLLGEKDYILATLIIRAFHMPIDPAFKSRMAEAIKKTASREAVVGAVRDMRNYPKDSPEYQAVFSFLTALDRGAIEILIALLGEENSAAGRAFLITILKDLSKNNLKCFVEYLSDQRWYLVRNIVTIIAQTRSEDVHSYLETVADHKVVQVRKEVIHAVILLGGKKAPAFLARFLYDSDGEIRLLAIRGFAQIPGINSEASYALEAFLSDGSLGKKHQDVLEIIRVLGRIGNADTSEFLSRYDRIRWWKPRKPQRELRAAAIVARQEIRRRLAGGGSAQR